MSKKDRFWLVHGQGEWILHTNLKHATRDFKDLFDSGCKAKIVQVVKLKEVKIKIKK